MCFMLRRMERQQNRRNPEPWSIPGAGLRCLVALVPVLSYSSRVRLLATPWIAAGQAPLSMGILQARILEWAAMPSFRGIVQT